MSAEAAARFMVVSPALPLEPVGTHIVVRRLLENFSAEEVVLLGKASHRRRRLTTRPLHYPVVPVLSLPGGIRGERYWMIASALPGVLAGRGAIRRYRPGAILTVFPDEGALLTGYWLHRLTGLPLLAYFCDLYLEDRRNGWQGWLARWLQPRVFASAVQILAVNEGMASYYHRRYGIAPLCLPTCINAPIPAFAGLPPRREPFVVGYSGNVNNTRLSSMRALVRAIGDDPTYSIRYFTPHPPSFLKAQGLWASNAHAEFISDESELVRRLSACDALFLPLTFEADEHTYDQLATCFGIKSYEYFLSQRPILLHSPGEYFIARFYRQWECGMVVDRETPEALAGALLRLREDAGLRERLVRNGLKAARQFEGPRVASSLRAAVAEILRGRTGQSS